MASVAASEAAIHIIHLCENMCLIRCRSSLGKEFVEVKDLSLYTNNVHIYLLVNLLGIEDLKGGTFHLNVNIISVR